ncbi:ATP-dependent RNA helicase SrmB [Thorsellia kenyensis]|uniref:ATP-dependent RNA helicase SrmB n=1 Tax=Thorsellia kenyensis TaxID=1549888 RepID=A0ABV6CEC6_9GAMM
MTKQINTKKTATKKNRTPTAKSSATKNTLIKIDKRIDAQENVIDHLTTEVLPIVQNSSEENETKDFSAFFLDESIILALEKKKFTKPTTIQAKAIPEGLAGKDILGSAPTGTGKSLAFLIPAIQHLVDFPRKHGGPPRVLILAPTRELANQIAKEASTLTQTNHLDVTTITGGVSYVNHAEIFSTNQDIVIATPGRLLQYIKEENFDCRAVEILILDEADRLLDMGFGQDVEVICAETRWRKQTMLFSATLEGNDVEKFAERVLTDPVFIEAMPSRKEKKKIIQYYYRADDYSHKLNLLVYLLKSDEISKTIVFVKTRERVHSLSQALTSAGITNCYLEGELAQVKREEAIKRLNDGRSSVLVATDVAARGIDIPNISHVINFDMPRTADVFLHRIGRTARAGKKGSAISLVEAHDFLLLKKVERYIGEEISYRVISELRPKTKEPNIKNGGKPSKKVKKIRKETAKSKSTKRNKKRK